MPFVILPIINSVSLEHVGGRVVSLLSTEFLESDRQGSEI